MPSLGSADAKDPPARDKIGTLFWSLRPRRWPLGVLAPQRGRSRPRSHNTRENALMQTRFVKIALLCVFFLATVFPLGAALPGFRFASSRSGHEQRPARRSVIDYFYLLPHIGIDGMAGQQERREMLLPRNHPTVDVRHDYLRVQPDSSPAEEIAVFRAQDKPDVIADSSPDFESDYNGFALYRLQNGKLRDVTRQMLPMPANTAHLLYELPQLGTTIRVFRFNIETESRRHAFDLQWCGGHFVTRL